MIRSLLPFRSFGSAGFPCPRWDQPKSGAFMDCHVFGFIALDEVLWLLPRSVTHVPLELRVGNDLLDDDSADPAGLGIPSDVITDLECFRHRSLPFPRWLSESARQSRPPAESALHRTFTHCAPSERKEHFNDATQSGRPPRLGLRQTYCACRLNSPVQARKILGTALS